MPRQPQLAAPDTLQQVLGRVIARTPLFRDVGDRADCLARLATLAETGAFTVYACNGGPCIRRLLASIPHYRPLRSPRECAASRAIKLSRTRSWWERMRRAIPQTLSGCSPRGRLDTAGGAKTWQHRRP